MYSDLKKLISVLVAAAVSHISTLRKQLKWWSNGFGCVHLVINVCSMFLWFFILWLFRPFPGRGLPFASSNHSYVMRLCSFCWHWAIFQLQSTLYHFTCSLSFWQAFLLQDFRPEFILGFLWQTPLLNALLTVISERTRSLPGQCFYKICTVHCTVFSRLAQIFLKVFFPIRS
jgi:hypothetical protein